MTNVDGAISDFSFCEMDLEDSIDLSILTRAIKFYPLLKPMLKDDLLLSFPHDSDGEAVSELNTRTRGWHFESSEPMWPGYFEAEDKFVSMVLLMAEPGTCRIEKTDDYTDEPIVYTS